MKINGLAVNWFDLAVVVVIGVGVLRGRSRGMSEELLDVIKWLVILALAGVAYRPIGAMVSEYTHTSPVAAYLTVYALVIVLVRLLFGWFKGIVGEKLVSSDVFGASEYYLGMLAGGVRFACYLLVGMAFLNAKTVSADQLAATARMQQDNFGDISFPTLGGMQQTVFAGSASGQFVKRYLERELIVASASDQNATAGETLGRQRDRAVSEIIGDRK
jgi:uncharacterized membrane protein required for colicin V production